MIVILRLIHNPFELLNHDSHIFYFSFYNDQQNMVSRNPGLLAVQPKDAGINTDNTMAASYVIAATRPIGIFGPITIGSLLMVPVIEGTTGIAIKEPLFAALGLN